MMQNSHDRVTRGMEERARIANVQGMATGLGMSHTCLRSGVHRMRIPGQGAQRAHAPGRGHTLRRGLEKDRTDCEIRNQVPEHRARRSPVSD